MPPTKGEHAMTTLKGVAGLWAIVLGVVVVGGTPAWAGTYLGEVCWWASVTADQNGPTTKGPFLLRAGVTFMGGSYYLVQGSTQTEDNPAFLHGMAVIVGQEVWISASITQDHAPSSPWRDSSVIQLRLNSSTLSGTFWGIATDFRTSDLTFDHTYGAGTVTATGCP